MPPTTSGCHHHHIHHCGACPLSSASKCAAQLPWTKLPGLSHHAASARDASSTLPNAVPTTLPGPAHGPAGLPRDPGWRSSRALPCQPASLQPSLHGCPEGGPLSVPWPLWLPLGYVVCEWCAGTVPYVPGVLCVSCLYMWLPLMLTRWGTILARVGWDQTLFSSSPEIMLPKISSQTQRMGWWGHPVRWPLRGGGSPGHIWNIWSSSPAYPRVTKYGLSHQGGAAFCMMQMCPGFGSVASCCLR